MRKLKQTLNIIGLLLIATCTTFAGTDVKDSKDIKAIEVVKQDVQSDYSLEVGSGMNWGNVRSTGQANYDIVPTNLAFVQKIDDIGLTGWRRGYTEFVYQGYYDVITKDVSSESHITGGQFGPRYIFVPLDDSKWNFFVGSLVGFGFTDSNPIKVNNVPYGVGQDFLFNFIVNVGAKYKIDNHWYVIGGPDYSHWSNAGLSESSNPSFFHPNNPLDQVGFSLKLGYNF